MKRYQIFNISTGEPIADLTLESERDVNIVSSTYHIAEAEESGLTLDEIKALYVRQIDAFAGDVRARFMSRGFGHEITYVEKRLDALNYIEAGQPADTSPYPFIHNEASATEKSADEVAASIIGRSDALRAIGSVVEAQRLRGGKQVVDAVDLAEVKAARNFAIASLDSHRS